MIKQANRIKSALDDIEKRNELTPSDPPQLLLLTRQLLESQHIKGNYPVVNLYCNWCVHCEITKSNIGFEILRHVSELLNRDVANGTCSIANPEKGVSAALRIADLREQLISLYTQFEIKTWLFGNKNFSRFFSGILEAIEEDPISFPDARDSKADRVYSEIERIAKNDPRGMIVSLLVTKDLNEEQLKFYNVPNGTFIWELRTAFDNRFASVLYCPV